MKKWIALVLSLCVLTGLLPAMAETPARTTKIEAHFASVEEGQQLMRNRTLYHAQINEKNLEFMLPWTESGRPPDR